MILRNKNAGCGEHQQPATIVRQQPLYHPPRRRVNTSHHNFPGRRDRAPARPSASSDTVSLGVLLLLLSANANRLTSREACKGWGLAERWAGQYVEMKHAIRGAA
jgi:hypothetical protein